MSTWTVITITDVPDLTEKQLQKAINRAGLDMLDQAVDRDGEGWQVSGHSKYEAEGIYDLAKDITRRHSGCHGFRQSTRIFAG